MYEIKMATQVMKWELTKIWKTSGKRIKQKKNFLKSNKKYRGKPLQKIKTSGKQYLRD
jgi:hypothetical protein